MSQSPAIRVLIADDHQLFRDGIKGLLASVAEMTLVGEAANGHDVVRLAKETLPDVILMDLQMPELNGIEATRQIVADRPEAKVLMLTMFEEDHSVFAAMRAGARGYVLKGIKRDELLRAIHSAAGGEAIFSPAIARRMMDYFASIRPAETPQLFPELTEREREVLALLARDYSNAQIAETLVISPKTVRNHVSRVLSKLQAVDRAEAGSRARDAGLG